MTQSGLALTFDDGPDPRGTPAVVDALDRVRSIATFFVIAPAAETHRELLERIASRGHRIALHCDQHVRHSELSEAGVREDTARALRRLDRLGVHPTLWRAPWGVQTTDTVRVAAEFGLTLVGWDVDTHDWRGDRAAEMFETVRPALEPGAVVLAHDGIGPGATRADCTETAAFVALVADHAARTALSLRAL